MNFFFLLKMTFFKLFIEIPMKLLIFRDNFEMDSPLFLSKHLRKFTETFMTNLHKISRVIFLVLIKCLSILNCSFIKFLPVYRINTSNESQTLLLNIRSSLLFSSRKEINSYKISFILKYRCKYIYIFTKSIYQSNICSLVLRRGF